MHNRGVSNVLGYVLLFGVIITSITIVGTAGVEQLTEARDGTVALNGESTMTGVADAVEDVHEENVSRTSRVGLGSGALEAGEETIIYVDIGATGTADVSVETDPIVYRSGDTRIMYVAGAVFRLEQSGESVVRSPNYLLSSDAAVISIPATSATDPDAVVSGSNAQVFLTPEFGSQAVTTDSNEEIEVTIQAPNRRQADLWATALDDQFDDCSSNTVFATCEYTTSSSHVSVRSTVTEFELST